MHQEALPWCIHDGQSALAVGLSAGIIFEFVAAIDWDNSAVSKHFFEVLLFALAPR
jgi:hypothetical protein